MNGKEIFNQLLGGIIVDDGEYKPFIMYFTGLKLSYLWEFGKEAKKYTHAKPIPVPMFAMKVKLATEEVKTDFGKSWVINFAIEKDEETDFPVLVMDEGKFQFLTIASLIASKTGKVEEEQPIRVSEPVRSSEENDDMPF
jgi:hypothetical protein